MILLVLGRWEAVHFQPRCTSFQIDLSWLMWAFKCVNKCPSIEKLVSCCLAEELSDAIVAICCPDSTNRRQEEPQAADESLKESYY